MQDHSFVASRPTERVPGPCSLARSSSAIGSADTEQLPLSAPKPPWVSRDQRDLPLTHTSKIGGDMSVAKDAPAGTSAWLSDFWASCDKT